MNGSPSEKRIFFVDMAVLWSYTTKCEKFVAFTP